MKSGGRYDAVHPPGASAETQGTPGIQCLTLIERNIMTIDIRLRISIVHDIEIQWDVMM
jgi:hypothetical protein